MIQKYGKNDAQNFQNIYILPIPTAVKKQKCWTDDYLLF